MIQQINFPASDLQSGGEYDNIKQRPSIVGRGSTLAMALDVGYH